ncbi:hypothetical protein CORAM0001_0843 [Corynebacterium amycolatum SK46]|nr:hypothetical protein CORAM0001_0843 [Corynebacterium amycolatum SK46]
MSQRRTPQALERLQGPYDEPALRLVEVPDVDPGVDLA